MNNLVLLPPEEMARRLDRVQTQLAEAGADALIVSDNANTFYLTGRVFTGYIYVPAAGSPQYFVRRPVELEGDGVEYLRKPEDMPARLSRLPEVLALELDVTTYSLVERLKSVFPEARIVNGSPVMRRSRAVKTLYEQHLMRRSGVRHEHIYRMVPHLYREGMTDIELQVEIERLSRLEGCLGQFRISGDSMEIYMGNLLVGDNADSPTPYDFAMGGAGLDPSLPVGANGSPIRRGDSVMVDMNGDFTGYMTDMTRTYSLSTLADKAVAAHECSRAICREIAKAAHPGAAASDLYHIAEQMADEAGLHPYFMGHRQKAGFVGHGLGIEINELPVIAPRSRDILAEGMAMAIEPKFVIPGTGAVGIENTYLIGATGAECITNAPEEIISLT